ncbi:MAG: iron chelate uptake ABC transporter family permease subunit [Planctomycetes bacterium]|jgi:iron complex transport system permease protein|nr:iron ABC transporter permease [Phycisphaerae bacterium]NBB94658.1 iron chelate uptake ABC transporter family permease subunit [Planctomycetota bacterium]
MTAEAPPAQAHLPLPPTLSGRRLLTMAAVLAGATAVAMAICTLFGQADLSWAVVELRLGRLVAAALVGAALASGGMALQAMLRNPLAEPYLLGISSGAGVGVLLGMALVGGGTWMAGLGRGGMAFVGAAVTCVAVYLIAQRRGRLDGYSLILSGVIVNAFNTAVMLAINLYVNPYRIAEFARWVMGEVPETCTRGQLLLAAVCVVGGWSVLFCRSAWFNAMGLGDEVAQSAGVRVARLRGETFVVVSLMAAAAVALAGPIGFLGLIVPHIVRLLLPADHRVLILASGFFGAMFLMAVDTACNAVAPYVQVAVIPVGIVTALMGGPFFLVLLRRRM